MRRTVSCLAAILSLTAFSASAEPWVVKSQWVAAHEAFLASDALRGRKSASPDEAIAAAYVAGQFQAYGLTTAPGMTSYLQTAAVATPKLSGHAVFTVGGTTVEEGKGLTLIVASGQPVSGNAVWAQDIKAIPEGDVVLVDDAGKTPLSQWGRAAAAKGAKLVIFRDSDDAKAMLARVGGKTRVSTVLDDGTPGMGGRGVTYISLSAEAFDAVRNGFGILGKVPVSLDLGGATIERGVTTNAIGWLQGTDAKAGVILITAHLDHLGVRPDGVIMHGANDDASGTTAVLEVAHALAAGKAPKRSVLFVAYGAEEIGGLGSTYFGEHPPVPLDQIIANLEFEMIGAQDPKMKPGEMMITGFDRSDLGETLRAKGAKVAPDLYPEQNFFQRSDNYSLALKGIVAHTISGWAVTPTYHDATDDIVHLDIPFMTQAIQSLIVPVEYLANSDFKPSWKPGGNPAEKK